MRLVTLLLSLLNFFGLCYKTIAAKARPVSAPVPAFGGFDGSVVPRGSGFSSSGGFQDFSVANRGRGGGGRGRGGGGRGRGVLRGGLRGGLRGNLGGFGYFPFD